MAKETRAINCTTFDQDGIGIGYISIDLSSTLEKLYVLGIGDLHGNINGLQRTRVLLQWARDNGAKALITGDVLNAALKSSVSHEHGSEPTMSEINRTEELFMEYKDVIVAAVAGNHDNRIWKETGDDALRRICRNAGIAYHPDAMVVVFRLGKNSHGDKLIYSGFLTHTYRSGRKEGGKLQKAVDLRDVIDADFYFCGHSHDLTTHKGALIKIDTRTNTLQLKQKLFANCGSECPYTGYAVSNTFPPSKLGCVRLRLDGKRHDMHISI